MPPSRTTTFSNREAPDVGQYRSVSWLAVTALVLGCLSALALAHPSLWLVPLLATISAVAALHAIGRRDGLIGRKAAVWGSVVALFFGSWAVTKHFGDRATVYREARILGQEWLQLVVADKKSAAHQLMLAPMDRQLPGLSPQEFYEHDERSRRRRDSFFDMSPARELVEAGKESRIRFIRNVSQTAGPGSLRTIEQEFEVSPHAGGKPLRVVVSCRRSVRDQAGHFGWQIDGLSP
jgi:hypothetical protein